MKLKYYFNGFYLIKGIKIFDRIVGRVMYSGTLVYNPGQKITVKSETFSEVNKDMVKNLKDFGYIEGV